MSELTFCKQYLSALDGRPTKLSSDHIADAKQYPSGAVFVLPRLPHPQHPQNPNLKASDQNTSSSSLSITLKPMKPSSPTVPLSNIDPAKTSIYDLKTSYSTSASIPTAKIKILYKKKPVSDSKTVAEVIGSDAASEIEFGVMLMGGAAGATPTAGTPVTSPPAVVPSEAEKGLGSAAEEKGEGVPAAQGPSGKEVVNDEFWTDLRGFVVQRIRDEKEGDRMVDVFKSAWGKEQ